MAATNLGARLKSAREESKLTQKAVCDEVGIPNVQTLSAYERDINTPSIDVIEKLSNLYKVPIEWIISGNESDLEKQKMCKLLTDLFLAADALGLSVTQEMGEYNSNFYAIRLENNSLRGFEALVHDVYKLNSARETLDAEDYKMLLEKRVNKHANESNGYEKVEPATYNDLETESEDNDLPF